MTALAVYTTLSLLWLNGSYSALEALKVTDGALMYQSLRIMQPVIGSVQCYETGSRLLKKKALGQLMKVQFNQTA